MTCKNCNAKLPMFSCYCENCGERGASFVEWMKFYWLSFVALLKKRIWLTIAIVGMLVSIIGIGTFLNIPKSIDVTDYIITETSGFNENGSIYVRMDYEALGEELFGKMPESETAEDYEKYVDYILQLEKLQDTLRVRADKTTNLKNGDFYIVTVDILDSEFYEEYGVKFKEESYRKTLQIGKDSDAFDSLVEINIFDYLDISFIGTNGYGRLNISEEEKKETIVFNSGNKTEIIVQYGDIWYNHTVILNIGIDESTIAVINLALDVTKDSYLSNGDSIEVSFDENKLRSLAEYGLLVETKSQTYKVNGLTD